MPVDRSNFHCFQFQQLVAQFFRDLSRLVAKWPLLFIVLPLLTTGLLGTVLIYGLEFDKTTEKNIDQLSMFIPDDLQSMRELDTLLELFPPQDIIRDSYSMLGSDFSTVTIEDISEHGNVLRDIVLHMASNIDARVRNLKVYFGDHVKSFEQLCYAMRNRCMEHPIVMLLNGSNPMTVIQFFLNYPQLKLDDQPIDNSLIFGGVELSSDGQSIRKAKSLRLQYIMKVPETDEEDQVVNIWQKAFIELVQKMRYPQIRLTLTTAISWSSEVERNGLLLLPHLPGLLLSLFIFTVYSCFTSDCVVSKPWLGVCGLTNACCAIIAAMGTLVYVGYPFMPMVCIMPFLILSISVDNMFILLNSWRTTRPWQSVEDRIAETVGRTAVSITITAITDGLAFSVGSISQFMAVRTFCTYCALAVLFVFIYQMTFFIACMALTGRREMANRHCLTFKKTVSTTFSKDRSLLYRLFCTGGHYHRSHKSSHKVLSSEFDEQFLTKFFGGKFADLLGLCSIRVVTLFVYTLYIGASIHGILHLQLGLDLKLLVPGDSYLVEEQTTHDRLFSNYGGYSFVVVKGTNIEYHDPKIIERLFRLYFQMSHNDFASPGDFWLQDFVRYTIVPPKNEQRFIERVGEFVSLPQFSRFRNDIHFCTVDDCRGKIDAIRMLIRARNVGSVNHTRRAMVLRRIFASHNLTGFIYDPRFILADQRESTVRNVVHNGAIAVVVMIAVSLLFIPKILSAIWIGVSILSINLGVVGGLAIWSVRLDIISMITIIMSIGFSVDFIAHITYHFLASCHCLIATFPQIQISRGEERRLQQALRYVGTPIVQSAVSTLIGVLTLAPVDAYIVRTFVKTVILVVIIGMVHGLLFLPVLLTICIPSNEYLENLNIYRERIGHYLASRVPQYMDQIRNKRMRCYFGKHSISVEDEGKENISRRFRPLRVRDSLECGRQVSRRFGHPMREMDRKTSSIDETTTKDLYAFLSYKARQIRGGHTSVNSICSSSSKPDSLFVPHKTEAKSCSNSRKESDYNISMNSSFDSEYPVVNSTAINATNLMRKSAHHKGQIQRHSSSPKMSTNQRELGETVPILVGRPLAKIGSVSNSYSDAFGIIENDGQIQRQMSTFMKVENRLD